jgi:hypothetical protein
MAKCYNCKSCLERRIYNNRLYLFCTLCRKAYTISSNGLDEVKDNTILFELNKLFGNRV